ncbi:MAG: hypothetical protein GY866_26655 [Proteobacteria bacterium]|nr:hypothetical protein [Pseudomonadota bacterium]
MFEATWNDGKIIPMETVNIRNNTRLIVYVVDDATESRRKHDWRNLRGRYKGKLNTVDEFIRRKTVEKELEL